MAETQFNNFVTNFSNAVEHLAQQRTSRFQSHVVQHTGVRGERDTFEQMNSVEDREITGERFTPMQLQDVNHARRSIFKRDWEWTAGIMTQDELQMNINMRTEYTKAAAMAIVRRRDTLILQAALGTSYSGKNGATSVTFNTSAFPTGNVINATASGLTEGVMRELRETFDISEEMLEDMEDGDRDAFVLAISPKSHTSLLNETQTTSRDFYQDPIFGQLPLVNGRIPFFMGFRIRVTNKLTLSSTTRYNLAWHRSAIGMSQWASPEVSITRRNDLTGLPWQVAVEYSVNAGRLRESAVFRVDTTET